MPRINELNDPFEGMHNYGLKICIPDENIDQQYNITDTYRNSCGVFSLSEKPDIPQMWVHYADNFRGICIEFSTKNALSRIRKVDYANEVASLNNTDETDRATLDDLFISTLLRKSCGWEYEKEWRLIDLNCRRNRFIQLDITDITAVILGKRISSCMENVLWQWREKRNDVVINTCDVSETSYDIEIY